MPEVRKARELAGRFRGTDHSIVERRKTEAATCHRWSPARRDRIRLAVYFPKASAGV
jgi:hypothetical protein